MSEEKPFVETKNIVKIGANKEFEVELPRLTLKKIMAVTGAVDKLVKTAKEKSPQLFELFDGSKDNINIGMELVKLVPSILPVILEEMVDVLSIYLSKDKSWIENNMDAEDLVAVATPFFADILKQGEHLIGPLSKVFQKEQPAPKQEISPEPSQS